jgi:hypothetical protein
MREHDTTNHGTFQVSRAIGRDDVQTRSPLDRLRAVIRAFYEGVPDALAADLIEELRQFSSVFRLDPSDIPAASLMLVCLQYFDLPNGDGSWMVWTPADDGGAPSVTYLRPDAGGIWRAWYPGELI